LWLKYCKKHLIIIGYYRVNYDFENWNKLMHYLNSDNYNKIHVLNRAQMIDDAFHFLLQKQFSYHDFWNLTNFIASRETNFIVWYPMFKAFEFLSCKFPVDQLNIDIVVSSDNFQKEFHICILYYKRNQ